MVLIDAQTESSSAGTYIVLLSVQITALLLGVGLFRKMTDLCYCISHLYRSMDENMFGFMAGRITTDT